MFYQFAHAGHDHGAETHETEAYTGQAVPKKEDTSTMPAPLGFGLAILGLVIVVAAVYYFSGKVRTTKK